MSISLQINGFFPHEFKYDLFNFHFHFNEEEEKQISYSQNNKITYKIPSNLKTGLYFQIKITRSDFLVGISELKIPYSIISKREKVYDQLCTISMTESMKRFIFGDNSKNFLKINIHCEIQYLIETKSKNLIKAKKDQQILIVDLKKFLDDFINGKLDNFNQVIDSYEKQKINIEELRKEEMENFKELKELNEKLSKEEADYSKDQIEMNQSLLRMKKKLAKTKLEENIFIDYEKNHIDALSALHKSNFNEEERKMHREIEEKKKESERISELNEFVLAYLREQKTKYEELKTSWGKTKGIKEAENEKKRNDLAERNTKKRAQIDKLTKDIQNYRMANDHLMDVASKLTYQNFDTIHGPDVKLPPIEKIPEQLDPNTGNPVAKEGAAS